MTTEEIHASRLAFRARRKQIRAAQREKALATHPPSVRYAKANFKKGKKHQPKRRQKLHLGVQ